MISFLKRLPKGPNLFLRRKFWFSTDEQAREYHKAAMASRIINLILSEPMAGDWGPEQEGHYPSLRSLCIDKIKDYTPDPNDEKEYSKNDGEGNPLTEEENARKFMMSYFIGGIWLHQMYCSQEQMEGEQLQKRKINQADEFIQDYLNSPDYETFKKVVFCPTYLVTTQLFQQINNRDSINKYVLWGHSGIGKSHAFILYRSLSEIIFRYKQKYCKQNSKKLSGIDFNITKLIYFSLERDYQGRYNQKKQKEQFNKTINLQCFMGQQQKQVDSTKDLNFPITQYAENCALTGVYLKAAVDQIDSQVCLKKQINLLQELIRNTKKERDDLQTKARQTQEKTNKKYLEKQIYFTNQDIISMQEKLLSFKKKYQAIQNNIQILKKFNNIIYLSFIDIEKNLLTQLKLNESGDHQVISTQKLDYEHFYKHQLTVSDQIQLMMTFLEQYAVHFKKKFSALYQKQDLYQLNEKQKQSLIQFKNYLHRISNNQYFHLTMKLIGDIFRQKKMRLSKVQKKLKFNFKKTVNDLKDKNQLLTAEQFFALKNQKNMIEYILYSLGYKNITQFAECVVIDIYRNNQYIFYLGISQFLKNSKANSRQKIRDKSIILLKLLYETKAKLKELQENPSSNSQLILQFNNQLAPNIDQLNQIQIRNIFSFVGQRQENKYRLNAHKQIVVSVLEEMQKQLFGNIQNYAKKFYGLLQSKSAKEIFLETVFRKILALPKTEFFYDSISKNPPPAFRMKLSLNYVFQPIPQIHLDKFKNYDFLKSFETQIWRRYYIGDCQNRLFEPAKKRQNFDIIEKNQIKHRELSNTIDFILTDRLPEILKIFAFDVAVSQDEVVPKVMNFLFQYFNFKDQMMNSFQGETSEVRPEIYYNVIIPTKINFKVNWLYAIENYTKNQQKQLAKLNQQLIKFNQQKSQADQISKNKRNSNIEKQQKINILQNKICMVHAVIKNFKKLNVTQKENSTSFFINSKLNRSDNHSFKAVEVISLADVLIRNQSSPQFNIYKSLLRIFQDEVFIQKIKKNEAEFMRKADTKKTNKKQ